MAELTSNLAILHLSALLLVILCYEWRILRLRQEIANLRSWRHYVASFRGDADV